MRSQLGLVAGALCGALLLLGGCLRPAASPPINLYRLHAIRAEIPERPEDAPILAIVPMRLPSYLRRDGIVSRGEGSLVNTAELNQWAEPLEQGVFRVIFHNLQVLLPGIRVVAFPWRGGPALDAELRVQVLQFGGPLGEEVNLVSLVRVLSAGRTELLLEFPTRITEPVQGDDHAAQVSAMNRAVEQLSREIAAEIEKLDLQRSEND